MHAYNYVRGGTNILMYFWNSFCRALAYGGLKRCFKTKSHLRKVKMNTFRILERQGTVRFLF